jgi:hypothetical protein
MRFLGGFTGIVCMISVLLPVLMYAGKLNDAGLVAMFIGGTLIYAIVSAFVCSRSTRLVKKLWGSGFWNSGG